MDNRYTAGLFMAKQIITLQFEKSELAALDAYVKQMRRQTGEAITRSEVIRDAIRAAIAKPGSISAPPLTQDEAA